MGSAAYPPRILDTSTGDADVPRRRDGDGRHSRHRNRARRRTGRSPTAGRQPFPGDARPDAHLREGRLRSGAAVRAGLHRQGSAGARRRPGGDARHRVVLPVRARRRTRGTPNPVAGAITHVGRDRQLAVGQLHQDLRPSRLQRGSRRADRLGRRLPVHRGAADADQLPLRRAGRRRRRCTSRAASRCCGGATTRIATRRRERRACSIAAAPRTPVRRSFEAFGSAEFWGLRMSPGLVGTDAGTRHPAAGQRPPLLHARHTHGGGRGGFDGRRRPPTTAARCRRTRTRWPTRRAR